MSFILRNAIIEHLFIQENVTDTPYLNLLEERIKRSYPLATR